MSYVVVTEDGNLNTHPDHVTLGAVAAAVGPHGSARVHVDRRWWMTGWVSDCGLVMPDTYQRNIIGSCLLAVLGAAQQPYAGNVVITGYDHDDDWGGPLDLHDMALSAIRVHHRAIRDALNDETPREEWATPEWVAAVREFADVVATCETPVMTVYAAGELL